MLARLPIWVTVIAAVSAAATLGACAGDDNGSVGGQPREVSVERAERILRENADEVRRSVSAVQTEVEPATSAQDLVASDGQGLPQTMDAFLTAVVEDVHGYWSRTLTAAGLQQPSVLYRWLTPGEVVETGCVKPGTSEPETTNDRTAAYCSGDDTIYVSTKQAADIWNGLAQLPGGGGVMLGDFGVAMLIAHEYGHNVQKELGMYDDLELQQVLPTKAFELMADCMAGNWANSILVQGRLEPGDIEEALTTAYQIGDNNYWDPGHHGTPPERRAAWSLGYETGNPGECNRYMDPSNIQIASPNVGEGGVVIVGGG